LPKGDGELLSGYGVMSSMFSKPHLIFFAIVV